MSAQSTEPRHLRKEKLKVEIYATKAEAGAAAAQAAAESLKELGRPQKPFAAIFATGASQIDMLAALVKIEGIPWNLVTGFHMDEYVGIDPSHPASFRGYLRERLTQRVPIHEFFEVNGSVADPEHECRIYGSKVRSANPQLCLLGIGENGHIAFNDPGVADFNDPLDMKVVNLDAVCRGQQFAEGWFKSLEEVPAQAMTLTIPTLLRVPKLIASVPGPRKAAIVRRALEEPISTACPATIFRTHPDVTVYLDHDSASELDGVKWD